MKHESYEWVLKAEGDFKTANREISVLENPNYDAVCFHAQQSVEKYLKARLVEAGRSFPKIHDLGALLDLVLNIELSWGSLHDELDGLTNMGVEVR
jgi:HEPN domain-containing protein